MNWGKMYEGAPDDRKWDLVAECAGSTPPAVWSVFSSAWNHALQHDGDLTRLSLELVAHRWKLALDEVQRIWREMTRLGVVAGNMLRAWAERQAPVAMGAAARTASAGALRVRRHRERKRAAAEVPAGVTAGVTCNASPLHPLSEDQKRGEPPPVVPPERGDRSPPSSMRTRGRTRRPPRRAEPRRRARPAMGPGKANS